MLHQESLSSAKPRNTRTRRPVPLVVEELEIRTVFTASGFATPALMMHPLSGPSFLPPFSPAQLTNAYGINLIKFTTSTGTVAGNGAGQTIAIIDAFSDPNIASDLATFDTNYKLAAPPSFKIVNQAGGSTPPASNASWGAEESLDVEWSHALAPKANILLVEANDNSFANLDTAIKYAAKLNSVAVVSMSFGGGEDKTEASLDGIFKTPVGHANGGVTFIASTGDSGTPGGYPAYSPNVLAVGGTSLYLNPLTGNYGHEKGWAGSGGGTSLFEKEPAYQAGVQSTGKRQIPDVSFLADPNTGVLIYDTFGFSGFLQIGGTSLSAPSWAALVAIVNQGRRLASEGTLSNMPADVYSLSPSDFHDVTSGNNGTLAGPGYDTVTGLGSPRANLVAKDLVGMSTALQFLEGSRVTPGITRSPLPLLLTAKPLTNGLPAHLLPSPGTPTPSRDLSAGAASAGPAVSFLNVRDQLFAADARQQAGGNSTGSGTADTGDASEDTDSGDSVFSDWTL
jgi:subtilase family serine protease